MEQLIAELVMKYPSVMAVVVVLGIFRMVFKPLVTTYQAYVDATPGKEDDERFEEIKSSSAYKSVSWFVDYLLSIKLPQAKPKKPDGSS